LPGFVRIAGLAVKPVDLFENIPAGLDYLMPADDRDRENLPFLDASEASCQGSSCRVRFEQCIECGLCQAACPVQEAFIGPAALAAVNRQILKKPDTATSWLAVAAAENGAGACRRHLLCSRVCPQAVYPAKHIQLLKNRIGRQPAD
ncbi:MAG: 4Fe-4S binding protein, partial [Spirochaetes bacterium]|nr:4Fe-4S binding protein [Spirochaetota bacterium]